MWEQLALQEAAPRVSRWQSSPAQTPSSVSTHLLVQGPATHKVKEQICWAKVGLRTRAVSDSKEDRLFVEARRVGFRHRMSPEGDLALQLQRNGQIQTRSPFMDKETGLKQGCTKKLYHRTK